MIDVSNFTKTLKNKSVAVFGLGRSNMAVIRALSPGGVELIAFDDREDMRDEVEALGARFEPLTPEILESCACLVLAPGVPLHYPNPHEVVKAAQEAGIEIICDIELFHRLHHGRKTIGITGTNGKSTTTALLTHVLNACGLKAVMGGNIGRAVFDLELPPQESVFVFELSSFQLDLCPSFRPDIAVLLNITPDHLDRHGTMENYVASKARIFEGCGVGIINVEDQYCRAIYEQLEKQRQRFVHSLSFSQKEYFLDFSGMTIKGEHNWQNAAAVYKVAQELGLKSAQIIKALNSFPGLAHRQCPVRQIGHTTYINDSKATNAKAAATALSAFENIYWIAGGRAKKEGLEGAGLEAFLPHVHHAFLIGEAAPDFARWMAHNDVSYTISKTLKSAVEHAHEKAQLDYRENVVLLSPACASFDQFSSFEERGERYEFYVQRLKEHKEKSL